MKIGLIGFGQMGTGAAYNLKKKYEVLIYDKDKDKVKNSKSFQLLKKFLKNAKFPFLFYLMIKYW